MTPSDKAILIDPLGYDPVQHGPPYLPGGVSPKLAKSVTAALMKKRAGGDVAAFLKAEIAEYRGDPSADLAVLLAALRAEAQIHQSNHWATKGPDFYGDHLLFERAYNDTVAMVDGLAERAVGSNGAAGSLVDPLIQTRQMLNFTLLVYANEGQMTRPGASLNAILSFLGLFTVVYEDRKNQGTLTPGMDNLLQGFADGHEQLVYLLQQRTAKTKTAALTNAAWKK